ncbi:hypothetical protein Tco_0210059 [Tanacetum coccineum]
MDKKVFPTVVAWRMATTKDDKPKANTYSVGAEAGVHGPAATEQEIPITDDVGATEATIEPDLKKEVISMGPTIKNRRRQRDAGEGGSNAPTKVLRKDHDVARAEHSARRGKSLADMNADTELAIHVQETQEPPVATQSVSDLDPLSSSKEKGVAGNQDSEKSTPSPPITRSLESIYQLGWGVPNSCHLDIPEACQDVVDHIAPPREKHIKDLEAQLEAEINMKKSTEAKNSEVSVLQAQVMGEKRIMAAFEDFKKREDERVNARYAEMDARLDALSVDFDEELYPHMLIAIAGRRWGMSKGLKYGVEHRKASLELTAVEAYDPEADNKYVAALHDLKDLNYPLIDELEQLKDAPLDVIMASLYLDSDIGEDAPQFIHELLLSSSHLKIPVYLEVRNPSNPWACKDEILLEDVIAANISHAEKKKKSRVICHTHGVSSAHHARSDGIPVSVPTIAPQGLQILLADAATQTEDKESPRLLKSKSLPVMFNLDWP